MIPTEKVLAAASLKLLGSGSDACFDEACVIIDRLLVVNFEVFCKEEEFDLKMRVA